MIMLALALICDSFSDLIKTTATTLAPESTTTFAEPRMAKLL